MDNADHTAGSPTIPGLAIVELVVQDDFRGWSKETNIDGASEGLSFTPTRWGSNYNQHAGVTRGVHAEFASKYVSLVGGEALAAIVDLRDGPTFGRVEMVHLTTGIALFIPIGCGNSYQTLTPGVRYTYLADDNIGSTSAYVGVNLADPDLAIAWPTPLPDATMADSDRIEPALAEVTPIRAEVLQDLRVHHGQKKRHTNHPATRRE